MVPPCDRVPGCGGKLEPGRFLRSRGPCPYRQNEEPGSEYPECHFPTPRATSLPRARLHSCGTVEHSPICPGKHTNREGGRRSSTRFASRGAVPSEGYRRAPRDWSGSPAVFYSPGAAWLILRGRVAASLERPSSRVRAARRERRHKPPRHKSTKKSSQLFMPGLWVSWYLGREVGNAIRTQPRRAGRPSGPRT